jgi:hypothetical protein
MTPHGLGKILATNGRKTMKRLEIYKKYQHSAGVKTLCTILHHQDSIDESVFGQAIEMMMDLTNNAMREANCEINEHGQQDFDDAVYFDFTMSAKQKISLLEKCDGANTAKAKQMIKELSLCQ